MPRIAFIGAGSVVFTKNLLGDILVVPGAARRRDRAARHRPRPARDRGGDGALRRRASAAPSPAITTHLDRRAALDGADYVLNMVQIGGHEATLLDFEIPARFGLRQTIADTLGIGGIFRTLRTADHMLALGREMAELCPRAWLLNYTNPMAMLCWLVYARHADAERRRPLPLGAVHDRATSRSSSACRTRRSPSSPPGSTTRRSSSASSATGEDLYPRLDARIAADPELQRRVRVAALPAPRLLPDRVERARCGVRAVVHAPRRRDRALPDPGRRVHPPQRGEPRRVRARQGRCSRAASRCRSSARTSTRRRSSTRWRPGEPCVIYGNVRNAGLLPGLPDDCCVEVPCLVDGTGLHPVAVPDYPPRARRAQPDVPERGRADGARGARGAAASSSATRRCSTRTRRRR